MKRLALLPLLLLALLLLHTPARADTTTPPPSWFATLHEAGDEWLDTVYATGIAFGDVDGDGRDEVAIVRNALSGARLFVLDDATAGFAPLWSFGEAWGAGAYATSVALGNIDADPADEVALTRATSVNERAYVFDDAAADFATLETWGADWGPAVHAIDIALSDDGVVAFANNANTGPRVFIYAGPDDDFAPLWVAGESWGAAATATAVAFGDSDGDGTDELGITRRHDSNARVFLHAAADGALLWDTGETWGVGAWALDIAFGNVDEDAAEEMGVARRSAVNERAMVFDDATADEPFATLARFGETWNPNAYATAIAFGDVDGDGRDEVAVARDVTVNPRVFIHDDALGAPDSGVMPFGQLWGFGHEWPGGVYATAVAFGQTDGAPEAELGVGRLTPDGPRVFILERGWASYVPVAPLPTAP